MEATHTKPANTDRIMQPPCHTKTVAKKAGTAMAVTILKTV